MRHELFSIVDGKASDVSMHAELLDNPRAERRQSAAAIRRAIAQGLDPASAALLYGMSEGV